MGRGIALQFRNAFPDNFRAYAAACRQGEVVPGRLFVYETGQLVPPRLIINFPTKRHWRGKSRIEDIEAGLEALVAVIREHRIESIAIPPGQRSRRVALAGCPVAYRASAGWPRWRARARLRTWLLAAELGTASQEQSPADDAGPCRAGRADPSLPCRTARSGDHAARGPQADVFHAGSRGTAQIAVQRGALWALCREPASRAQGGRGAVWSRKFTPGTSASGGSPRARSASRRASWPVRDGFHEMVRDLVRGLDS